MISGDAPRVDHGVVAVVSNQVARMPYRLRAQKHVSLLLWTGLPTLEDIPALIRELVALRKQAGRPLIGFGIVPDGIGSPSREVREEMIRTWPTLMQTHEVMLMVIEGDGVKSSLIRTMLRGMMLVARVQGVVLCASVSDATSRLRSLLDADLFRSVAAEVTAASFRVAAAAPFRAT
jgi:hypothetical protein